MSSAEQQVEGQKQDAVKSEPGLSFDNPIIINKKDIEEAEAFIIDYIEDHYPDYSISSESVMSVVTYGSPTLRIYSLEKKDEDNLERITEVELYFDITIASEEFRKKNEALIRELVEEVKIIEQ